MDLKTETAQGEDTPAKKPYEIIYSAQHTDFDEKLRYANPRFFSTPREQATKVTVVGNFPAIVEAYKKLDIPVVVVKSIDELKKKTAKAKNDDPPPPPAVIPDKWRELGWPEMLKLARACGAEGMVNKDQATAAIEAEEKRRAAAAA